MYDEAYQKTKVVDDGGKYAKFDETFHLANVFAQIRMEESLIIEAYDKDPVGADLLGTANPLKFCNLCVDENEIEHELEIYDKNYKQAGHVNISTRFEWAPSDPIPKKLTSKSKLILTVVHASFLKDADMFGNQDPYIQFDYKKDKIKTQTQDDAGKEADFNETFTLINIKEPILNGEELILEAYDEDLLSSDLLGVTRPIPW